MRIPSETRFGPILSVAIGTIGVAACSGFPLSGHGNSALPAQRSGTLALRPADGGGSPIRHVIIVIQENRSFDNFFATFPGADGATSGLAAVTPSPGGSATPGPTPTPKVVPLAKRDLVTHGYFANVHGAWLKDYDGGAMDGFDEEEYFPRSGPTKAAGTRPYYYVDPARIKPYWTMAKRYALADHMFQTQTSASFTAHQYLIAGSTKIDATQSVVDLPTSSVWGCNAPPGTVTSLLDSDGTYVQRGGPFPCFTYKTIRDLLDAKSISWRYYAPSINSGDGTGGKWNAFAAIAAVYQGSEWSDGHISTPQTNIFSDIQDGALPAVSWIVPDWLDSDHPGSPSDSGPSWVASIVNAVGTSSYWSSTAIVVVWDDWGGLYDHVSPPQLGYNGLGFRVPMIVVSPYAKSGYISHTQYEFGSILKFVEITWRLGRLGTTDVRANSIADMLDFSQPPSPFVPIAAKYPASYFLHRAPSGRAPDDY